MLQAGAVIGVGQRNPTIRRIEEEEEEELERKEKERGGEIRKKSEEEIRSSGTTKSFLYG